MFTFEDLQREIGQQNRTGWEELWNDLLRAESPAAGLTAQDIDWDYRVSVGDGGRDVTIKRGSQRPNQPLIPDTASVWSVKSGANGIAPGTLASELDAAKHADLVTTLQGGANYRYCVCYPTSADQRTSLDLKARELEGTLGLAANAITVIHSDHLVDHLKRQLGVVKTHCSALNASLGDSMKQWGRSARPIFDPTIPFVDIDGRSSLCDELVEHLTQPSGNSLVHLAGLSGIGKTRLVYEACLKSGLDGSILYYSSYAAVLPMLTRIRDNAKVRCTLVVDECSLDDATNLQSQLDAHSDRVRAISIGPARSDDRSRDFIIVLPPPIDAGVLALLKHQANGSVPDTILEHIARASSHDIRFALQLWEVVRKDQNLAADVGLLVESLGNPTFVFRRVLEQFPGELGDHAAFLTSYRWMTLGRHVGFLAPRRDELEYVAALAGESVIAMVDLVAKAKRCGLGEAPAHLFEAVPRGLATLIFSRELWPTISPIFNDVMDKAPSDSFRKAIMQRVELCADGVKKEVRSRVDLYFRQKLGDAGVMALETRQNARTVRAWIELSPDVGLSWLAACIADASMVELTTFKGANGGLFGGSGPRREIIWAVTHLASFAEYYEACEAILFRLALAENEGVANNATAEWKERHRIMLSKTEVPYDARIAILLRRLSAASLENVALLLDGLLEAVTMPHSAMAPPVVIGGRLVPPEWRPKTNHEIYERYVDTINRAVETISEWPSELRQIARSKFIAAFDHLYKEDTIEPLRAFFEKSEGERDERILLRNALEEAVADQRRSDSGTRGGLVTKLENWLYSVQPLSPEETIKAAVSRPPWEYHRIATTEPTDDEIGEDKLWYSRYENAAKIARDNPAVLDTLEKWFEKQDNDSLTAFGRLLAEVGETPQIADLLAKWLGHGKCAGICFGFCDQSRIKHGTIPSWSIEVLDRQINAKPEYVARMTAAVDPTQAGFDRIMRCAKVPEAKLPLVFERVFGFHWRPLLDVDHQRQVLDALITSSPLDEDTQRVLSHLLRMYLHAEKSLIIPESLRPAVLAIIQAPTATKGAQAEHEWSDFALKLARTDPEPVLKISIELAVKWRQHHNFANGEAIDILAVLANAEPEKVLREVVNALMSEEFVLPFAVERWQKFFARFDLGVIERVLGPSNIEFARRIGQFVPDPVVSEEGQVVLSPMTEWYLRSYGGDEECYREFSIGRWNGRLRSGWAWEKLGEVERDTKVLLNHPIPALRRWAQGRLEQQRADAVRDRIDFEDINNR